MDYQNSLKRKYDQFEKTSFQPIFNKNYENNLKYPREKHEKKLDITLYYNNKIIENPWRYLKIKE